MKNLDIRQPGRVQVKVASDGQKISNIDEFRVGLVSHQVYMTQWTHHDSSLALMSWD